MLCYNSDILIGTEYYAACLENKSLCLRAIQIVLTNEIIQRLKLVEGCRSATLLKQYSITGYLL